MLWSNSVDYLSSCSLVKLSHTDFSMHHTGQIFAMQSYQCFHFIFILAWVNQTWIKMMQMPIIIFHTKSSKISLSLNLDSCIIFVVPVNSALSFSKCQRKPFLQDENCCWKIRILVNKSWYHRLRIAWPLIAVPYSFWHLAALLTCMFQYKRELTRAKNRAKFTKIK